MTSHSQRARSALIGLALVLVLLLICVAVLTQSAWGRAQVRDQLQRILSDQIPGRLTVASLETLSATRAVVSGLSFEAPTGETVLQIERAELHFDALALLRGAIRIDGVEAHGGRLEIEELRNGDVPLEYTFAARTPESDDSGTSADLSIKNIAVDGLTVVIDLQGVDPLTVEEVKALVRVELQPSGYSEVIFEQAAGHMPSSPVGGRAKLSDVSGHVRGKAKHVLVLHAAVEVDDEAFELDLDYYNREETPVEVRVGGLDVSLAAFRTRLLALGSELTSVVDVSVTN